MGIVIGDDGLPVLDENGKGIPDCALEDYQQCRTLIMPTQYYHTPPYNLMRFHLNLGNPAVKAYTEKVILNTFDLCKDNAVFIDNVSIFRNQVYDEGSVLHYISRGDVAAQAELYADQYVGIIQAAVDGQKRINPAEAPLVLANGMLDSTHCSYRDVFQRILRACDDLDGIIGAVLLS